MGRIEGREESCLGQMGQETQKEKVGEEAGGSISKGEEASKGRGGRLG